jgi:hypothetical protein
VLTASQNTVAPLASRTRCSTPQTQQKIERLTRLPKAKQKLVLEMLDGVLPQAAR